MLSTIPFYIHIYLETLIVAQPMQKLSSFEESEGELLSCQMTSIAAYPERVQFSLIFYTLCLLYPF
jgi:hypothetical protein